MIGDREVLHAHRFSRACHLFDTILTVRVSSVTVCHTANVREADQIFRQLAGQCQLDLAVLLPQVPRNVLHPQSREELVFALWINRHSCLIWAAGANAAESSVCQSETSASRDALYFFKVLLGTGVVV